MFIDKFLIFYLYGKKSYSKKSKIIFAILPIIVFNALSEDVRFGLGFELNHIYARSIFLPVPSLSLYLIKKETIHSFSLEYISKSITKSEGAFSYSLLRNLHSKSISLGPCIGLNITSDKVNADGNIPSNSDNKEEYIGLFVFGIKGMVVLSRKHFGLTISDRLLLGSFLGNGFGFSNLFGMGLSIIF